MFIFSTNQFRGTLLAVDLAVGLWAWPMPMDYDGAGKPDLLLGAEDGFFYHLPHDEAREYPAKARTARKPK